MKDIFSIRWHSRAGQGAVTAANFITEAMAKLGYQSQSFPDFGAEKRGAAVINYNRFTKKNITLDDPAQITEADMVILVDTTLLGNENTYDDILENLKLNGILFLNTNKKTSTGFNKKFHGKIFHLDGTSIAMDTIHRNLPNVPMIGGFTRILGIDFKKMKSILIEHLTPVFSRSMVEKNIIGFNRGYKEVIDVT